MIGSTPWIMITILVLVILLGIVAIIKIKKKNQKQNYYSLFIMGAVWVPFGLFMMLFYTESTIGSIFFILGWIYFVTGIIHHDEWDKKRGPYLIENEKLKMAIIIGLIILLILGIAVLYFLRR